eukprot:COSAG02_NODE_63714_length_262_cov_0.957055_1_plen_30_part_01
MSPAASAIVLHHMAHTRKRRKYSAWDHSLA